MTWSSPDPWQCYACGATGLGGHPAQDAHVREHHTPPAPKVKGSVVPAGIDSRDVRAFGLANGWKLGGRGRLPQDLIDQYVAHHMPAPRVDLDQVDDLRHLGYSTHEIANRMGVLPESITTAEQRRDKR